MPLWTVRKFNKLGLPASKAQLLDSGYVYCEFPETRADINRAKTWCTSEIGYSNWYYNHDCFWFNTSKDADLFRVTWVQQQQD